VQSCDDRESAFCPALRSVPARDWERGSDSQCSTLGMRRVTIARRAILNAGDDLQQVRGALLAECAYWLVTCEIVTSGPRSPRVAAVPPRLVPRAPVPGRRKFLANSDFLTMDFVVDVSS
jgi:hypothetical protein